MRQSPAINAALRVNRRLRAFTLIELLVVIAIIGLLAAVGLPAFKGFGKSNSIVAADRQLLDDFASARQRALAEHTTVYVVFSSPIVTNALKFSGLTTELKTLITNVATRQYASYAFFAQRSVGDQPGQSSARYLTPWRSLPDGIFIPQSKFLTSKDGISPFDTNVGFPFPSVTNASLKLPYLAFNSWGQLGTNQSSPASRDNGAEYIPLARGFIEYDFADPFKIIRVQETPAGNSSTNATTWNHLRIDGLTGRAKIEQFELQ